MTDISLSLMVILPLLSVLGLLALPAAESMLLRRVAIAGAVLPFVVSCLKFWQYDRAAGGFQFVEKISWVAPLGISYHVGVDGINLLLVLLLGLASVAGILMVPPIKDRFKEYYILLLLMIAGTYGAFLSLDIFFFFFFHEVATIPTFLMISMWGSNNREHGAMKITLYLTAGASLALIGLIGLFWATGLQTFDFVQIQQHLAANPIPVEQQNWIFPLIVAGFAVTVTLWPFYTWAPVGYATAPTPVSMLHAGVLKKMGAYAILRFAIQLMPEAAQTWMPLVATLAIANIVYCGLVALTQRDLKYLLAYSSCSHMGYILLGLACLNVIGVHGVVFLMFAHGVMAALAFALVGFVTEQTGTRNLDELGGLAKSMPFIATCFVMAAMASAGVPGFGNFVAEMMVLAAAWDQYRWQTILAILGIVITAVYMLKAVRLVFQGPLNNRWDGLQDAGAVFTKIPFLLLLAALMAVGCFPSLVTNTVGSAGRPMISVEAP